MYTKKYISLIMKRGLWKLKVAELVQWVSLFYYHTSPLCILNKNWYAGGAELHDNVIVDCTHKSEKLKLCGQP